MESEKALLKSYKESKIGIELHSPNKVSSWLSELNHFHSFLS